MLTKIIISKNDMKIIRPGKPGCVSFSIRDSFFAEKYIPNHGDNEWINQNKYCNGLKLENNQSAGKEIRQAIKGKWRDAAGKEYLLPVRSLKMH